MADNDVALELIAAVYPNTFEAQARMNDLTALHEQGALELVDAAVMVRQFSGKLEVTERAALTVQKGAKRGALIGAVIGVVFPPSLLASAALGAAAGAVAGQAADRVLQDDLLDTLGQELKPGRSAVIGVVGHEWYPAVLDALDGYDRVIATTLDETKVNSKEPQDADE